MGKAATAEEAQQKGLGAIPLTIGHADEDNPNLDLIGDDDDDIDPMLVAMQEQLEDMKTSQKEEREFLQNTIIEMSQRPPQMVNAAPANTAPAAAAALDFENLPDPVENRKEFNEALGTRITDFVAQQSQNTTALVTAQQQSQGVISDLENRFTRDYKDLATKPALFQATLTQAITKIKNRGLNPQSFVAADPDKFLTEIAKSMKDELGITDDDNDEELNDENNTLQLGKKVSRTKGVKSGSMAKLKKAGESKVKKPLSFVREIKKQQHAMGLI